jgi:hypothetical protein
MQDDPITMESKPQESQHNNKTKPLLLGSYSTAEHQHSKT